MLSRERLVRMLLLCDRKENASTGAVMRIERDKGRNMMNYVQCFSIEVDATGSGRNRCALLGSLWIFAVRDADDEDSCDVVVVVVETSKMCFFENICRY